MQAPELFMQYYGLESDLWALGILMFQVPAVVMILMLNLPPVIKTMAVTMCSHVADGHQPCACRTSKAAAAALLLVARAVTTLTSFRRHLAPSLLCKLDQYASVDCR